MYIRATLRVKEYILSLIHVASERKIILVLFEHAGNLIPSATALIGQGLES